MACKQGLYVVVHCVTRLPYWAHLFYLQWGTEAAQAMGQSTKFIVSMGVNSSGPTALLPT